MQTEIYPDSGSVLRVFLAGREDNILNIASLGLYRSPRIWFLERNIDDL
jgi:hypothetical protein